MCMLTSIFERDIATKVYELVYEFNVEMAPSYLKHMKSVLSEFL